MCEWGGGQTAVRQASVTCIRRFLNTLTLLLFYSSSSASIQPVHPQSRLLSAGVCGVGGRGGAYYSGSYQAISALRNLWQGDLGCCGDETRRFGKEGSPGGRELSIRMNKFCPFTHLLKFKYSLSFLSGFSGTLTTRDGVTPALIHSENLLIFHSVALLNHRNGAPGLPSRLHSCMKIISGALSGCIFLHYQ